MDKEEQRLYDQRGTNLARAWEENGKLQAQRDFLMTTLQKIAAADYRGNRSPESAVAYGALRLMDKV